MPEVSQTLRGISFELHFTRLNLNRLIINISVYLNMVLLKGFANLHLT